MSSLDYRLMERLAEMERRDPRSSEERSLPLRSGGSPGGMDVRLAKLESAVEHVQAELVKLSGVPVELARLSERVNHLPTKTDVDAAIDRAAHRNQRTLAVAGGLITLAMAVITYVFKFIG